MFYILSLCMLNFFSSVQNSWLFTSANAFRSSPAASLFHPCSKSVAFYRLQFRSVFETHQSPFPPVNPFFLTSFSGVQNPWLMSLANFVQFPWLNRPSYIKPCSFFVAWFLSSIRGFYRPFSVAFVCSFSIASLRLKN